MELIQFLDEHHVDLNDVKSIDSTSRNPLAADAPPQGSLLVAEQNVDVVASDLRNDLDKGVMRANHLKKCLNEQSAWVKNTEEPARKYESQALNLEHSRKQSTLSTDSRLTQSCH
ncbi:Uncharacterized protein Fot_53796 [Forsythia ovata]|uniref:Uncharacterized protein n=1 Tax=Forsythia ovata TaxID=205694 RepID=A0ABD1PF79_9LAMI